jgi:hypothetical protein
MTQNQKSNYLFIDDYFELYQERAAIYEYEAALGREQAELKAFRDIIKMRDENNKTNLLINNKE